MGRALGELEHPILFEERPLPQPDALTGDVA